MKKKRSPKEDEDLLRDPADSLKKIKKSQPEPPSKQTFVFTIRKQHTNYIQLSNIDLRQDSKLSQDNIVSISLQKETIEPIKIESVEVLKQFLAEYFQEEPKPETELSKEAEEKDLLALSKDKELSTEELYKLRNKLIHKLWHEDFGRECIADIFGISAKRVYGITANIQKKLDHPVTKPQEFRVTQEMYDELDSFMSQKCNTTCTLKMMRNHIAEVFHLPENQLGKSTISNMLKKLNYSRKRGKNSEPQRNKNPTIEKRQKVAQEYLSALKAGIEIIFLDESGFNQGLRPLYGYSKVGQPCLIGSEANFQNYCVVTAITNKKILGFQVFRGSVETNDFGAFLAGLVKANPELLTNRSMYAFYMDNAPIHHARCLKPFLNNFNVIYGAPYTPFLNPIEEIFSNWKRIFRNDFVKKTSFLPRVVEAATQIDQSNIFGFFDHSMTYLKDCLNMKPIL